MRTKLFCEEIFNSYFYTQLYKSNNVCYNANFFQASVTKFEVRIFCSLNACNFRNKLHGISTITHLYSLAVRGLNVQSCTKQKNSKGSTVAMWEEARSAFGV